jgi:membrane-associated phospholipid phosphatase
MNPFDHQIITGLNRFAHHSWTFDTVVWSMGSNDLLKAGLITALLYWAWFRNPSQERTDDRGTVVFGLVASCSAVLLCRVLSAAVPFRMRPLGNPDLHFVLPYSMNPRTLIGWNAFPSDNAALFFGAAACIYLVSRRAGIVAFCHVALVVAFARVYLGIHHPTDILAGALIGIGAVSLIHIPWLKSAVIRVPMRWLRDHPQSFQAAVCVLISLIGTTFGPLYPLWDFAHALAKPTLVAIAVGADSWGILILGGLLLSLIGWALIVRLRRLSHSAAVPHRRNSAQT